MRSPYGFDKFVLKKFLSWKFEGHVYLLLLEKCLHKLLKKLRENARFKSIKNGRRERENTTRVSPVVSDGKECSEPDHILFISNVELVTRSIRGSERAKKKERNYKI